MNHKWNPQHGQAQVWSRNGDIWGQICHCPLDEVITAWNCTGNIEGLLWALCLHKDKNLPLKQSWQGRAEQGWDAVERTWEEGKAPDPDAKGAAGASPEPWHCPAWLGLFGHIPGTSRALGTARPCPGFAEADPGVGTAGGTKTNTTPGHFQAFGSLFEAASPHA